MCCWHRRWWCSPDGGHEEWGKKWKNGIGASICQCNRAYGTGLILSAHSRPFQFLLYEGEGMVWLCFGNWFSCLLAGIVSLGCPVWLWAANGCAGCLLVACQAALHGCVPNPSSTEQDILIKPSQKWLMLHLLQRQSQHWGISFFVPLVLRPTDKNQGGAQSLCRLQIRGWFWAWLDESFMEPNLPGTVSGMLVDCRPLKVFYILNYSVILREDKLDLWVSIPSHWL